MIFISLVGDIIHFTVRRLRFTLTILDKGMDMFSGPYSVKGGNMAKVKNVEKKIWDLEGFAVQFLHLGGRDVRSDRTGLPQYPYKIPAADDMTVQHWKEIRFLRIYPGFEVEVLDGEGHVVHGNTKLTTLRSSYCEDED